MLNVNLRKKQGITLIALVVTIVVLLILAAVSISMLTGENGIITQAQDAKEKTIIGEEKEAISVSYTACKTKDYSKDIISSGEMQEEINKIKKNVVVSMSGDNLIVYFQDTEHRYIVNQNGQISETDLNEDCIIDMIDSNIAVTLSGKVIYIDDSKFTEEQLLELNIEDYTVITENGVRKAEEGVFVDNTGKVYTWGRNGSGQLGDGSDVDKRNTPICISELENDLKGKNIINIYSSYSTVIALDNAGKVYTWGDNYNGQLGDGSYETRNTPICISELENDLKGKNIIDIWNDSTVIALDDAGKVYTWGFNYSGELGNGNYEDKSNTPICISELGNDLKGKNIVNIWYGSPVIALDDAGKVYTWGYNYSGQLGDGSYEDRYIPICISELENDLKGKNIVEIYLDGGTVIALDNAGKVYTWGDNDSGQLGDGSDIDKRNTPICISELGNDLKGKNIINIWNDDTVIALDDAGKVYTWGKNGSGQLGDGSDVEKRNTPICISELENDLKGKNILNIYSSYSTVIALDNVGKVYTWGDNDYGQLGDGGYEDRYIPICISELENDLKEKNIVEIYLYLETIIALDDAGKVYTWGDNNSGQIGDGSYENKNTPICINQIDENVLNGKNIRKCLGFSFYSSWYYNRGYCYISQDGKIYYYYYQMLD